MQFGNGRDELVSYWFRVWLNGNVLATGAMQAEWRKISFNGRRLISA